MPQYPCPKCQTILKRDQPLPDGKKVKCPKCQNIFSPTALTAAGPKKSKLHDDMDNDRNPYGVVDSVEDDAKMQAEKTRAAEGLVKDRFKKSARGPALKEVVRPSHFLLAAGVFECAVGLIVFVCGIFPLIFQDFYSEMGAPPAGVKYSDWEEQKKLRGGKMTDEQWDALVVQRIIICAISTFYFIVGSVICVGAMKMRTLDSYAWSMVGAVTCLIQGFFPIGLWAIIVLSNKTVKDGFAEEKPPEV